MTVSIRPRLLGAIAKWAYPTSERPHINVVLFDKRQIVATDGHRLAMIPYDGTATPFGIRPDAVRAIVAAHREVGGKYDDIQISPMSSVGDSNASRLRVVLGEGYEMTVPAARGDKFPPIDQVIPPAPKTLEPTEYRLNVKYLAAIDEMNREHPKAGSHDEVRIVAWERYDSNGLAGPPMFEGAGGMRFIIMPLRGEREIG